MFIDQIWHSFILSFRAFQEGQSVSGQLESVYQSSHHTGLNEPHVAEEEHSRFFVLVLASKSSTVSDSRFLVLSLYHLVMLSVLQIGCQFSVVSLLSSVLRSITLMKTHKELQKQEMSLILTADLQSQNVSAWPNTGGPTSGRTRQWTYI